MDILASGTYLAVACGVAVAFGFILVDMFKKDWYMLLQHVGCGNCICNVGAIFIQ